MEKDTWILLIQTFSMVIMIATLICVAIQTRKLSKQTKSLENSIMGNIIWQITTNHRELLSNIFNFPILGKALHPDMSNDEIEKKYFLSMFINHAESIYQQSRLGNISQDYWEPIETDMINMFNSPEVKARWEEVKIFHSKQFQEFIDKRLGK